MKRSFDASLVHIQDNTNNTTQARSLHRRSAPLATHPFYIPQAYNDNQTYYFGQPLPTPNRYLIDDYDRDSDFQSNVWFQPTANSAQYWTNLVPARRPLTGLGISFAPHDGGTSSVPYVLGQEPVLGPFSRVPSTLPLLQGQSPDIAMEPPSNTANAPSSSKAAYSARPEVDYVAHSPAHPSLPPYSQADNFLMMVDSPSSVQHEDHGKARETGPDHDIPMLSLDSSPGPVVGLFADVNFRAVASEMKSPNIGVNPGDISGDSLALLTSKAQDEDVEMQSQPEHPPSATLRSPDINADFPADALSAIVSVLVESVKQEQQPAVPALPPGLPASITTIRRPIQAVSAALPIPPPAFASRTALGARVAFPSRQPMLLPTVRSPLLSVQPRNLADHSEAIVVHRGSPILNAHEGIELEDLRARAEAFRRMNPGCELDKTFLQAFAGRLSERGELIPEFRCYVKNCAQSNKRRDHILVHVGSHVEHRPFQCDEWCVDLYMKL